MTTDHPNSGQFPPSGAAHPVPPSQTQAGAEVLQSLSHVWGELSKQYPDPVSFLRALMRELCRHHRLVCFGMKGHVGAQTLADFASVPEFSEDEADQLRSIVERNLVGSDDQHRVLVTGPRSVGEHSVCFLSLRQELPEDSLALCSFAFLAKNRTEIDGRIDRLRVDLAEALTYIPRMESQQQGTDPVELVARVAGYKDTREFAFALVESVARRFGCQKVAMGLSENKRVQVIAVSGTASFKASSPGIVDIQQAMEECFDAGRSIAYQTRPSDSHAEMPIHVRWAKTTQSAVFSVPLKVQDRCIGVVSLQREVQAGFTEEELAEIQSTLSPFAPAIELARKGDRSLGQHMRASLNTAKQDVLSPKTKAGRIFQLAALVLGCVFCLGWMPYRPINQAVIVPADLTQSLAPFDMQLRETFVRSGDTVDAGQLLAQFDTRELELERASILAKYNQAEVDVRQALIESDAAQAAIAKADAAVYKTQLETIDKKIESCSIRAPDKGMVVVADLSEKLGQVFRQGDAILAFAPMDAFTLDVHVPESQARFVEAGDTGNFVSHAAPGKSLTYTIENIAGSAELIDGKNVFVAKARIEENPELLRHGMEGFARTNTGWQPIPWVALHGLFDYARVNYWF